MKKIISISILILIFMTACNLAVQSDKDEQIIFMQQTIEAMQAQNNNAITQPQVDSPAEKPPTQAPSSTSAPTNTPTNTPTSTPTNTPTNTPTSPPQSVFINPAVIDALAKLTTVLEFDNVTPTEDTCHSSRQDMNSFGGNQWREGDQLFAYGYKCIISFKLPVPKTGIYKMELYATYAPDFGNLTVSVYSSTGLVGDLTKVYLYNSTVKPTGAINLGNKGLSVNDNYIINLVVTGRDSLATDYKFGIDYLTLIPQ